GDRHAPCIRVGSGTVKATSGQLIRGRGPLQLPSVLGTSLGSSAIATPSPSPEHESEAIRVEGQAEIVVRSWNAVERGFHSPDRRPYRPRHDSTDLSTFVALQRDRSRCFAPPSPGARLFPSCGQGGTNSSHRGDLEQS